MMRWTEKSRSDNGYIYRFNIYIAFNTYTISQEIANWRYWLNHPKCQTSELGEWNYFWLERHQIVIDLAPPFQTHLFVWYGRYRLQETRGQLRDEGHSRPQQLQGDKQPYHWQRGQKGQCGHLCAFCFFFFFLLPTLSIAHFLLARSGVNLQKCHSRKCQRRTLLL